MKYLFIVIGVVFGVVQFLLLRKATAFILIKNSKSIIIIAAKLVLYALGIAVMWFFFRQFILYCGIGLGAGMVLGSFINYLITNKSDKKGDDAA